MAQLLPELLKGPVLNQYGTSKNQYGTRKGLALDQYRTIMQPVGLVWHQYGTSMGPVETKTSKFRTFMGLVLEHYGLVQTNTGQYKPV